MRGATLDPDHRFLCVVGLLIATGLHAGCGGSGGSSERFADPGTTFVDGTSAAGGVTGADAFGFLRPTCSCTVLLEDADGDADLDVFVGNHEYPDVLYENTGIPLGSPVPLFLDVAPERGLADPDGPRAAEGGLLLDLDGDGFRDLYVLSGNVDPDDPPPPAQREPDQLFRGAWDAVQGFVRWSPFGDVAGITIDTIPCGIGVLPDWSDPSRLVLWRMGHHEATVYRDQGGLSYLDVSASVGVAGEVDGDAMGVALGDYDNDGDLDVYVGSGPEQPGQSGRNLLYENRGGVFVDVATARGVDDEPSTFSAAWGDYDNDGDLDLYQVRNGLYGEDPTNALYRNLLVESGAPGFADVTATSGTGDARRSVGAVFADLDNDGWLDLYVANGGLQGSGSRRDTVFRNQGDGTFLDVTVAAGVSLATHAYALTVGDVDLDGFPDLYVGAASGDENTLLRNAGANGNHALMLDLVGRGTPGGSHVDAIGARVLVDVDGSTQLREIAPASPGNHVGLRVHVGLGTSLLADRVEVRWPSGFVQVVTDVPADVVVAILEP